MPRLFAALEIPRDVALALSPLCSGLVGAHWIDAENYHITLQFFGDVEALIADEIVTTLDRIVSPTFTVQLKGLGIFTPNKPHSLYATVEPCTDLLALAHAIRRKVRPLDLNKDKRSFTPHVTLARLRHVAFTDLARYLGMHGGFTAPTFTATRFVLMSSRDSVGGGPYLVEASWPLKMR